MTDFSSRLKSLLPTKEEIEAMATSLGKSPSGVTHWVKGRREPDLPTIERIAELKNISPAWLAFGLGETQDASGAEHHAPIKDPLVELLTHCTPAQRRIFAGLVADLTGGDAC